MITLYGVGLQWGTKYLAAQWKESRICRGTSWTGNREKYVKGVCSSFLTSKLSRETYKNIYFYVFLKHDNKENTANLTAQ